MVITKGKGDQEAGCYFEEGSQTPVVRRKTSTRPTGGGGVWGGVNEES